MEKNDKTRVYCRKENVNSSTGKVEVSFGCYYKEDMDGDVLTGWTFFTTYNETGDIWYYHIERDNIEESDIEEHPEMIIPEERYTEMLKLLNRLVILRTEYNDLFLKL